MHARTARALSARQQSFIIGKQVLTAHKAPDLPHNVPLGCRKLYLSTHFCAPGKVAFASELDDKFAKFLEILHGVKEQSIFGWKTILALAPPPNLVKEANF